MTTAEATRTDTGRVEVTIAGETLEASPAFWRAILFDAQVRDRVQPIVTAHLREPITAPSWWNGDGRH